MVYGSIETRSVSRVSSCRVRVRAPRERNHSNGEFARRVPGSSLLYTLTTLTYIRESLLHAALWNTTELRRVAMFACRDVSAQLQSRLHGSRLPFPFSATDRMNIFFTTPDRDIGTPKKLLEVLLTNCTISHSPSRCVPRSPVPSPAPRCSASTVP